MASLPAQDASPQNRLSSPLKAPLSLASRRGKTLLCFLEYPDSAPTVGKCGAVSGSSRKSKMLTWTLPIACIESYQNMPARDFQVWMETHCSAALDALRNGTDLEISTQPLPVIKPRLTPHVRRKLYHSNLCLCHLFPGCRKLLKRWDVLVQPDPFLELGPVIL